VDGILFRADDFIDFLQKNKQKGKKCSTDLA